MNVIFDLDGTLIDSSASILAGFTAAFAESGRTPVVALDAGIIGPPLRATLARLAGSDDAALLDALAARFKAHYDHHGYRETTVFPGVADTLAELHRRRLPLYIATNKRLAPTLKILDFLGWADWFDGVYALDFWTPPATDKREMIRRVLAENALESTASLYVGDRAEDGHAAAGNTLAFALAAWGYGDPEAGLPADWRRLDAPDQLLDLVTTS